MSTPSSAPPPPPPPALRPEPREIRIYSHSALFYWWPVWAVGFLMFILTYVDGHRLAAIPPDTIADSGRIVQGHEDLGPSDVLIFKKSGLPKTDNKLIEPSSYRHIANNKDYGAVFCIVLLLIILVSNVPLRGLWSLLIILFVLLVIVIFRLAGWWEWIMDHISLLDIRINAGGYAFISTMLFIIWALTVLVFDRRTHVIVTPGQVRVCMAIGTGETVYDTTGMTFSKRQDDLFRHWIVGLGSGDLIIHRTNTNQEIDMPNVLFIGFKVKEIEQMLKEREVV